MKDKSVFKVNDIDKEKLARSFGLLNAPTVEIVAKKDKNDRVAMLREQAQARKMAKQLGTQMAESDSSVEESGDDDDFFTKTSKTREIVSDEEVEKVPTKLSKRKLNKITADGPYQGKNVTVFAGDGTKVSKDAFERQKYLDSLKINMREEDDVESESDEQENYLEKVKSNLMKNQEKDTELAK